MHEDLINMLFLNLLYTIGGIHMDIIPYVQKFIEKIDIFIFAKFDCMENYPL